MINNVISYTREVKTYEALNPRLLFGLLLAEVGPGIILVRLLDNHYHSTPTCSFSWSSCAQPFPSRMVSSLYRYCPHAKIHLEGLPIGLTCNYTRTVGYSLRTPGSKLIEQLIDCRKYTEDHSNLHEPSMHLELRKAMQAMQAIGSAARISSIQWPKSQVCSFDSVVDVPRST